MAVYTINNQSPVDKAFVTHDGFKIIAAGTEGTVETSHPLPEDKIAVLKADGCDVVETEASEGLNGNTVPELKAIAEAESIDLGDASKKADIIAAIELAREEKAKA